MASRSVTSVVLGIASIALFLAGFVFVAFYVMSVTGPHLRYLGAGFLAALAAFVVGCLVGLVVGIPRFVSSGAMRHVVEANVARTAATLPAAKAGLRQGGTGRTAGQPPAAHPVQQQPTQGTQAPMGPMTAMTLVASGAEQEAARTTQPDGFPAITDQSGADPGGADPGGAGQGGAGQGGADPGGADLSGAGQGSQFSPSSNLAEISDWLTKLLLGAGLVELTRLGHPLSSLIDAVARGLQGVPAGAVISGTPVIVAASILVMYVVLGFLDGYVLTTLWYGKHLQRLGYS